MLNLKRFRNVRAFRWLLSFRLISYLYYNFFTKSVYYAVPKGISNSDFLKFLKKSELKVVLLRWYDGVDKAGDLDVLLYSTDRKRVEGFCDKVYNPNGRVVVDFASVDEYIDVPVFHETFAKHLYSNAALGRNGYYILATDDYVNALIFHMVLHKGYKTGLDYKADNNKPLNLYLSGNKYIIELNRVGFCLPTLGLCLEYFYNYLDSNGLLPPIDLVERLSRQNAFLEEHLSGRVLDGDFTFLGAFICRGVPADEISAFILQHNGADLRIKDKRKFSPNLVKVFANHSRGGVWPEKDGGRPSGVVFVEPLPTASFSESSFQSLVRELKYLMRIKYNKRKKPPFEKSIVHTSDTSRMAHVYLEMMHSDD